MQRLHTQRCSALQARLRCQRKHSVWASVRSALHLQPFWVYLACSSAQRSHKSYQAHSANPPSVTGKCLWQPRRYELVQMVGALSLRSLRSSTLCAHMVRSPALAMHSAADARLQSHDALLIAAAVPWLLIDMHSKLTSTCAQANGRLAYRCCRSTCVRCHTRDP